MFLTEIAHQAADVLAVFNPGSSGVAPPGGQKAETPVRWFVWAIGLIALVTLLMHAVKLFKAHRRGEASEVFEGLGVWFVAAMIVASAAPIVNAVL